MTPEKAVTSPELQQGGHFLPAELVLLKQVLGFKMPTLLLFLLFIPHIACAQIVITEIMYDLPDGSDSGREWVEVYNAGSTPVDLTKLRFFENGTNHKITAIAGANVLAPATYAVIADNAVNFKADWPQFAGTLFDSAFSLSNDGETLTLRGANSTVLDTISYTSGLGGAGDGNSLNRAPGSTGAFVPHTPSPGATMSTDVIPPKAVVAPAPKTPRVSKTKTTRTFASSAASATPETYVAAAATAPSGTQAQWWLAAAALIAATGAALYVASRYAKNEWDIVEER